VPVPHGIPYSICVGNHDQGNAAGSPTATTNFYNQYFGEARFTGRPYYGGHFGTNNDNHYELFSAGGIDFIHISIEYNNNSGATNQGLLQGVLDWADGLLKTHSNRKGILSTHWIMGTGIGGSFGGPGLKIYDELKDNPNLIFLLCGHIHGEGRRSDTYNGSTVHTVLSDYQDYPNGGNGFLRIMQFKPSENVVTFKTYSPTINGGAGGFQGGANSEFTLSVNLGQTFSLIGANYNVPSSSATQFTWSDLLPLTSYEWYVTIEDGDNIITSGIFEFTTAGALPLTLLNFKALNEKNTVRLEWTTTAEEKMKGFVVERSTNGNNFQAIGSVHAKNTGGIQQYDLTDGKPVAGRSWYRLKILDADNNFTYSRIASINRSNIGKFDINPNPAVHNEIRIVGLANTNEQVIIKVYDLSGRMQLTKNAIANGQDIILRHNLVTGMYNVECIRKSGKENKQIIIR
jgi:hypothetical protein